MKWLPELEFYLRPRYNDGFFTRFQLEIERIWSWLTIVLGDNYYLWNFGLMFIYPENADLYFTVVKSLFLTKGDSNDA